MENRKNMPVEYKFTLSVSNINLVALINTRFLMHGTPLITFCTVNQPLYCLPLHLFPFSPTSLLPFSRTKFRNSG